MAEIRTIKKILTADSVLEGAGVHLRRGFGHAEAPEFDPFLLFDDFRSDVPAHYLKGFPWHPHRGIETITYVLEGDVEHGDSLGNKGVIGSGDVQWMTAGSGIIHQEMPRGSADGHMYGFQLWANLPAKDKMIDPRYRGLTCDEIPEVRLPGGVVMKIIAGNVAGTKGPLEDIVIDPVYIDVNVPEHSEFSHVTKKGHTVFVYVFEGNADFSGETQNNELTGNGSVILFEDGELVKVVTDESSVRFLLVSGMPIGEPVAWQGPIVMNTREELNTAFEDYNNGTFIR